MNGETSASEPRQVRRRDHRLMGWTVSQWLAFLAAALAISFVVALRNFYAFAASGQPIPFRVIFANEVPVWVSWLALLPGIKWLTQRFPPFSHRVVRNTAIHVAAAVASTVLTVWLVLAIAPWVGGSRVPYVWDAAFWPRLWRTFVAVSISGLLIYGTIAGLVLAWSHHRAEQERRARESELEATLARTERDLLRTQIHPHFLFNTLHTISAMVGDDPRGARQMIARLSDLLRLSLEDDARHEVTLEEELEFLGRYIDIQSIRFQGRLTVRENVDPDTRSKLIPRLLLQPLMENAVQHGIAHREEGGLIEVRASLASDQLVVEIANDGTLPHPNEQSSRAPGGSGAGLGLRNTAARLHQLYGAAASVQLHRQQEGGAIVRVVLPAHEQPISEIQADQESA